MLSIETQVDRDTLCEKYCYDLVRKAEGHMTVTETHGSFTAFSCCREMQCCVDGLLLAHRFPYYRSFSISFEILSIVSFIDRLM